LICWHGNVTSKAWEKKREAYLTVSLSSLLLGSTRYWLSQHSEKEEEDEWCQNCGILCTSDRLVSKGFLLHMLICTLNSKEDPAKSSGKNESFYIRDVLPSNVDKATH
jgi:hypothetical protein